MIYLILILFGIVIKQWLSKLKLRKENQLLREIVADYQVILERNRA